ncbi:MAG: hypothetical protein ACFFBD_25100 [Candidatus Hodarchaeota archaeon]
MTWLDELLKNIPRELDYMFSFEEMIALLGFIVIIEILTVLVVFSIYWKLRKAGISSAGGQTLLKTTFGLLLVPMGRILDFVYRILTGNTHAIFVGNTNVFFAAGLLIFIIYYASYARNYINISEFLQIVYRRVSIATTIITISCLSVMLIHLFYPLDHTLVNLVFITAGILLITTLALPIIFSMIDFFRISNKLTKVRLGLTVLAGALFLVQVLAGVVYLALATSGVSWLIPLSTILDHGEGLFISLLLLWSFFVPEKLQEWARVLPPSFQALKVTYRFLEKIIENGLL